MRRDFHVAMTGALLTALSLTAACRVGPHYQTPALPSGADAPLISVDESIESTVMPPDAWWQLYNEPRLSELILEALRANHDLAIAEANLNGAKAVLSGARAQIPVHGDFCRWRVWPRSNH